MKGQPIFKGYLKDIRNNHSSTTIGILGEPSLCSDPTSESYPSRDFFQPTMDDFISKTCDFIQEKHIFPAEMQEIVSSQLGISSILDLSNEYWMIK
jgi:hypothetical protein